MVFYRASVSMAWMHAAAVRLRAAAAACVLTGAALGLVLTLALPADHASARAMSDVEKTALAKQVERFDAAMRGNDFPAVVETIPPKVMEHIAKTANISVDDLRKEVITQMTSVLAEVKLVSFSMDLAKGDNRELADGTPFVLIPTETVMELAGPKKFVERSQTLALLDEGAWYLLRVSEAQQMAILRQVYPGFAAVEFPAGKTEAVKDAP